MRPVDSTMENVEVRSLAAALVFLAPTGTIADELIPRSSAGDKGTYYLLEAQRTGDFIVALHKRVGPSAIGHTRTETNCRTMQMREIGYSEDGPGAIKANPTKWFDLVPGSSKSDLAAFVCKRR